MKNKEVLTLRISVALLLLWIVISFLQFNYTEIPNSSTPNEIENIEIQHTKDLLQSKYDNILSIVKKDSIKAIESCKQLEQMKKQALLNQAKIKLFDSGEIALYFKERYELWNDINTTANGTEISDTVGIKTISDLIAGDDAINQLRFINAVLNDCKNTSLRKDTLNDISNKNLLFTEKQYVNCQDDFNKLKNQKQKETFLRVLVGGGLGINKELNQFTYSAAAGLQNKKGNIIRGRFQKIGAQSYYLAEYDFSILNWKR